MAMNWQTMEWEPDVPAQSAAQEPAVGGEAAPSYWKPQGEAGGPLGGLKSLANGLKGALMPSAAGPSLETGLKALDRLGFAKDSPEAKLFSGYVQSMHELGQPKSGYGAAQGLGDLVSTYFLARGGAKDPLMYVTANTRQAMTHHAVQQEKLSALMQHVLGQGADYRMKLLDEERRRQRQKAAADAFNTAIWGQRPPASAGQQSAAADPGPTTRTERAPPVAPAGGGVQSQPPMPQDPQRQSQQPAGPERRLAQLAPEQMGAVPYYMQRLGPEARGQLMSGLAGILAAIEGGQNLNPAEHITKVIEKAVEIDNKQREMDPRYVASMERTKREEEEAGKQREQVRAAGLMARNQLETINHIRAYIREVGLKNMAKSEADIEADVEAVRAREGEAAAALRRSLLNEEIMQHAEGNLAKSGINSVLGSIEGSSGYGFIGNPWNALRAIAGSDSARHIHHLDNLINKLGLNAVRELMGQQGSVTEWERQIGMATSGVSRTAPDLKAFVRNLDRAEQDLRRLAYSEKLLNESGIAGPRVLDHMRGEAYLQKPTREPLAVDRNGLPIERQQPISAARGTTTTETTPHRPAEPAITGPVRPKPDDSPVIHRWQGRTYQLIPGTDHRKRENWREIEPVVPYTPFDQAPPSP